MLKEGQPFPEFSLLNQDLETVHLSDFKGRWLVVYVYPKDDTPGCTLEGRGFSAAKSEFEKVNTQILGLSEDDAASHKDFCNKYQFSISLLADPQAKLLKSLGIEQSEYKGVKYWNRTTFLVDPIGKVKKVYKNVKPDGHEKAVLEDLKKFQSL